MADSAQDEVLQAFYQTDEFRELRERLASSYYDKPERDRILVEAREAIARHAGALPAAELEDLQKDAIMRLFGMASREAKRPAVAAEEPPAPARSQRESEDFVIENFPHPIAVCYYRMDEARTAADGFSCLVDAIEAVFHYLATVVLSQYWRDGAWDLEHNQFLLERFYKEKWSTGIYLELLRETVKLYRARPEALPYPQLVRYLFTARGAHSSSLKVFDALVNLRNLGQSHGGGRGEALYANILPPHRELLSAELNRCHWLATRALWLPKNIDENNIVTVVDKLNGLRPLRERPCSLQIDPDDLDSGDIIPEKTLLLVEEASKSYLPLFPFSLLQFNQNGQAIFFLQTREWESKAGRLIKAVYISYEFVSGSIEGNTHNSKRGEKLTQSLESKIRRLADTLQAETETLRALKETVHQNVNRDIESVWTEQQYHLKTFAGREEWIQGLSEWANRSTERGYLVVLGPPGQGKSAFLAQFAYLQSAQANCVFHMIKSSKNARAFLQFLLWQAAKLNDEILPESAYEGTVDDLRNNLVGALERVRQRRSSALMVIDALDELDLSGDWIDFLPPDLPDGVRVVLSCRPDLRLLNPLRARLRQLTEVHLPALAAEDLPRFLENYLGPERVERLRGVVDFGALFSHTEGNPLFLQQAMDDIRKKVQRADAQGVPLHAIDVSRYPNTTDALFERIYNEIAEKDHGQPSSGEGRLKAAMIRLLAVALEPLSTEDLRGLLEVQGHRLSLEDTHGLLVRMSKYLLAWESDRYLPFHQGLTDYVLQKVLGAEDAAEVHQVFCEWLNRPQQRGFRYYLLHYATHLLRCSHFEALDELSRGDYLRTVASTFGVAEALTTAREIVYALTRAGEPYWGALLASAHKYCTLVEEVRGDPRALVKLIEQHEIQRLMTAIMVQPELYRGVLLLAVTPLLIEAGDRDVAERTWQEGLALVDPRLRRGLLAIEGYDRATAELLHTLAKVFNNPSAHEPRAPIAHEDLPPDGSGLPLEVVPRKRVPLSLWLPSAVVRLKLKAYAKGIAFGGLGYMCTALVFESFVAKKSTLWAALDRIGEWSFAVALATAALGLLLVPLQWLAGRLLRRRAEKEEGVLVELARGVDETSDPRQRARLLERLLRLVVSVPTVSRNRQQWTFYSARWVSQQFALVRDDAKRAALLVLEVSKIGDQAGEVMIGALSKLEPNSVEAIHRWVMRFARRGYMAADYWQVLRIMAGTVGRSSDMEPLADCLAFYLKVRPLDDHRDVRTLLAAMPAWCTGKATLESLERKNVKFRFGIGAEWATRLRWTGISDVVGRYEMLLFLALVTPAYVIIPLVFLYFLWPYLLTVLFAGRVYDPFRLTPLVRDALPDQAWKLVSAALTEPDFSLSGVWNSLRTGRFPIRAGWLNAPMAARQIRETVYAQLIMRRETPDPAFESSFTRRAMRRVISVVLKAGIAGPNVVAYCMDDRNLLNALPAKAPPGVYQERVSEALGGEDQTQLNRVLPLVPAWWNFALTLGLSVAAVLFERWLLLFAFASERAPWYAPFVYGGVMSIGVCIVLAVTQHMYPILSDKERFPKLLARQSDTRRTATYQLVIGWIFLLASLALIGEMENAGQRAGLRIRTSDDFDVLAMAMIPAWIAGLLVPALIARWRGAGLFYPSAARLWGQRVLWTVLTVGALVGLAAYTRYQIRDDRASASASLVKNAEADFDQRDYDKVIAESTTALKLDPNSDQAYYLRALASQDKGLLESARSDYLESIRRDPKLAEAYGNLAWIDVLTGRADEAVAEAQEGLKIKPGKTWIMVNLADAYWIRGQNDRAKEVCGSLNANQRAFFAKHVREDFAEMDRRGIKHPDMRSIEPLLQVH